MVYSRDILGEPGSLHATAPRLLEDNERSSHELSEREREERTLEELRFVPGDFLLVSVLLPKNVTLPSELSIKGSGAAATPTTGVGATPAAWRTQSGAPGKGDGGWGRSLSSLGPAGRGGGHWRGESNAPSTRGGRGSGGRGGGEFGRDRERDRERDRDVDRNDSRVPPPRRNEPPSPRGRGGGRGGRGGRGDGRSRSRSRSRSPRRRNRYD